MRIQSKTAGCEVYKAGRNSLSHLWSVGILVPKEDFSLPKETLQEN